MAMADESAIRLELRKRLLTTSLDSSDIVKEGRKFDPPAQVGAVATLPIYVLEFVRVLNEIKETTDLVHTIGEALYLVETPANRGTEQADAIAKEIAEAFESGQTLIGTSVKVILYHTERRAFQADLQHPAWMFKPVSVRWRVFTVSSN